MQQIKRKPSIFHTFKKWFANISGFREQLLSKTRKREIALPRQLAMYFAKEYTNATFTKIGEEMGGKDHSTVMYACETIRDVSKIDKELKKYLKRN